MPDKRRLLCRLGFHDWEYLYHAGREKAWIEYKTGGRLTVVSGEGLADGVFKRVCLACGKQEDTVTPFLDKKREQEKRREDRQREAERLYQNDANDS